MNLFGKKKETTAAPADPTPVIMKLRETLETLDKREAHLQKKITGQIHEAKAKSQKKDKKGALFALKRKKMYEVEINKINGARMTLEQQVIALEGSNMNFQTFRAMQMGAKAMKDARGQLDAEDVDDVMYSIEEEMDINDQIADAISRKADGVFDDETLLAELEELDEQELDDELLKVPPVPLPASAKPVSPIKKPSPAVELPDVPRTSIPLPSAAVSNSASVEDPDVTALRELAESMNAA